MKRHLVLVVALVVLSSGVVAGSSYKLTADNAIDTPDRTVEVAGMSYEITEIAQFDSGEEITVTVTGPEGASVQLRDEEGSIIDFKRLPEDGTQQVSFSSEGLTPGIYGIALNVDGSFEEVLPVVISGYDLTVTTPDAATTNDTVTVSVDLEYEALTNPPEAVEIALWNGDFLSDTTAEKVSDQTYEADFDLENAPTGEFQTYAVAISDEKVNGYPNPLAVGTDSTLTVTDTDDEDSTDQSGDDGNTDGDDSSDSDDSQEDTDSDGDGTESGSDGTEDGETNDQTGDEETDSDGTEDGETDSDQTGDEETDSGGDDGTDGDQTDDGQSGDEQGTDDGETDDGETDDGETGDGTNQEDSNDEDDGSGQDNTDDGTADEGNSDSDEEGDTDNETTDGMNENNDGSDQDGDSDGADENNDGTDQDGDDEETEQTSSTDDDAIEPDDGGADTEENADDSGPGFGVILVAAIILVLASLLTIGLLLRVRD